MQKKYILFALLFFIFVIIAPVDTNVVSAEQSDKTVAETINGNKEKEEGNKQEINNNDKKRETSEVAEDKLKSESLSVTFFDMFKILLALAFVIFLIYFLLKFVNKRNRFFKQARYIENIGGMGLGANKSIQIVRLGDKVLVLGVGESITLIKEIDNEEESRKIIEEYENKLEQMVEPKQLLQKVTKTFVGKNEPVSKRDEKKSFALAFKEQLTQLKNERSAEIEDVKGKGKQNDE